MTSKEAKIWLNKLYTRTDITDEYGDMEDMQPYEEAVDMAIKALEQEPCEDAISRQAALDCLTATKLKKFDFILEAREEVKKLPPVTLQPKTGKWIIVDDCERFIAKCSACGRIEDSRMIIKYPYCHCGARMQEVGE